MNPTCAVLEERMSKLDGGVAAMAVSSGQAASAFSIQNICHSGDNFISSTDLYGGTWNLFSNTLKEMGIECRFIDPTKPEQFENAIDSKTRCIYAETLPNPKLNVFPINEVSKIGKNSNVPLIMDNIAPTSASLFLMELISLFIQLQNMFGDTDFLLVALL